MKLGHSYYITTENLKYIYVSSFFKRYWRWEKTQQHCNHLHSKPLWQTMGNQPYGADSVESAMYRKEMPKIIGALRGSKVTRELWQCKCT